MESVMLSVKPSFFKLIAEGTKNIELRKTRPKLEVPFKCFVYCSKCGYNNTPTPFHFKLPEGKGYSSFTASGIAAEFVCDRVEYLDMDSVGIGFWENDKFTYLADKGWNTGLTTVEWFGYTEGKRVYGWHISNLVIYDKPKEFGQFRKPCANDLYCESCAMYSSFTHHCGNKALSITRPPQSWQYVSVND